MRIWFLLLPLLIAPLVGEAQWRWMEQSVVTGYVDEDWRMLEEAAYEALNALEVGGQVDWRNPKTGARGSVKAFADVLDVPQRCRRTAFQVFDARGNRGQGVYVLCQQEDDRWLFVSDSQISAWQSEAAANG